MAEMDEANGEETGRGEGETGRVGEWESSGVRESEDSGLRTQNSEPIPQPPSPDPQIERFREEQGEARAQGLAAHRRALLAENAGRVVPELVTGSTVQELEESVEVARRAYDAVRTAALAEMVSAPVPAGNPVRQGLSVEGLSSLEKIAYGLKREQ